MIEVGIDEARERLVELLGRVEAGETVRLTRKGKPAVRIILDEEMDRKARSREAIQRIRALRASLPEPAEPVTVDEIIAWKNEGRS